MRHFRNIAAAMGATITVVAVFILICLAAFVVVDTISVTMHVKPYCSCEAGSR